VSRVDLGHRDDLGVGIGFDGLLDEVGSFVKIMDDARVNKAMPGPHRARPRKVSKQCFWRNGRSSMDTEGWNRAEPERSGKGCYTPRFLGTRIGWIDLGIDGNKVRADGRYGDRNRFHTNLRECH